ncbi:hypothetical protein OQA88_2846 [Cercophora sp. LCS_1]
MEGVEQTASGPAAGEEKQQQQQQQQQQEQPQQHQNLEQPSPAAAEVRAPRSPDAVAVGAPASTSAAAITEHYAANGVAPTSQHASASPGTRTGTPLSHPSTPTINGNGHPLLPPLSRTPDSTLSAEASAAINAIANANNAGRAGGMTTASKEHLRWRDPMTVKYDGGQAQPGKLQAQQPPPPQAPLHQLPPPPTQHHQLQQHSYPLQIQPPPLSQQSQQPQSQTQQVQQRPDPLPTLPHPHTHAHPHSHSHPHPNSHSQQVQSHTQNQQAPPHQHHQPPPPLRQPPLPLFASQPNTAPATLPPLHHSLPPASSQPLPPPPVVPRTVQPIPVQHSHTLSHKPIIMDPPGRRVSQPQQASSPRSSGFPSPTQDHARINNKFVDDCTRLTYAVQQSLAESVRRVVRDNWEKCLLGSEFHQAFVLNASIHHAVPSITRRAVRDFGRKMVAESKDELINHFSTADLDAVMDQILSKASDSFLDRCLEKRLLTIEAKPLINALAKAERLGYDPSDMVQEDQHERVIPQEAYPGAGATAASFSQRQPQPAHPQPANSPSTLQLQCTRCFRTFVYQAPYDYHVRNNICSATPPTAEGFHHACSPCGQGFTSVEELHAHMSSQICGGSLAGKSRGPGRPPRTAPVPQANPVAILPSVNAQSPGQNGYHSSQAQPHSTPVHSQSIQRSVAITGTPTASPNPADPYGHLSKQELDAMNEELRQAEAKYAPRFREAESIVDENERRSRIEGLRNSFGTKQSMIRKKYGVRLRERRTKAEIQAEKERLGIKRAERAERERAKAALSATSANASPAPQTDSQPVRPVGNSGWTAANTPRANNVWEEHDAKRRRMDAEGGYHTSYRQTEDTPTRKTLSVTEMGGGLSGSAATAATQDPTARPQPIARESATSPVVSSTPNGDKPQVVDLTTTDKKSDRADDASSSDDEDIPPTLPSHIRQSLTPSKPVTGPPAVS